MMKIVDSGYKIDLHIHSISSSLKDKAKVSFNTLQNINVLADRLNENGVQICAITDHDTFDYDMYKELKKYEKDATSSIEKVFPGVEFSVEFDGDNGKNVLHVIAIFNDEDETKVKSIQTFLINEKGTVAYDRGMSFSEEKFLSILRNIDIDTVLIAHQKSSLTSSRAYQHDAKTVGDIKFNEFVYTDYFEAFEFRNKKNEVFNKSFLNFTNQTEAIRFITGSDCHDWRYYPKTKESDNDEFIYTYVKCLPTFRGLVMAITDHRRIKTVNSFFSSSETYIKQIDMKIDGQPYSIPLSRGLNVVIGDNSVGKSLLLHRMTGYCKKQEKLLKASVIDGYTKYLKENKIEIETEILNTDIFAFDMQGEVREKFEKKKIKSVDFLRTYYPDPISVESYKEKVKRKLEKIFTYLENKFEIEIAEAKLGKFIIYDEESTGAESLTFVGNKSKDNKKVSGYKGIVEDIDTIIEKIEDLMDDKWIEETDVKSLEYIIEQLDGISMKYNKKRKEVEFENDKIALFQAVMLDFKQQYQASVSDTQKKFSLYNENINKATENITELIRKRNENLKPDFYIDTQKIDFLTNRVYNYDFNSRVSITEISEEYIKRLFEAVFNKNVKCVLDMTQSELAEAISYYGGLDYEALEVLKTKIYEQMEKDFANKFTITEAGTDRTKELSSGFNSKIYFDLLSYESNHEGIYIIDQPEDNISQKSIREYLLDRFKVMGENRQVIIVTHNPQFIVNLDVDNVIYIGKDDGRVTVQSGALEYKNDRYNILDIISNHIEGGLDTLKRRWKRYEKNNSI